MCISPAIGYYFPEFLIDCCCLCCFPHIKQSLIDGITQTTACSLTLRAACMCQDMSPNCFLISFLAGSKENHYSVFTIMFTNKENLTFPKTYCTTDTNRTTLLEPNPCHVLMCWFFNLSIVTMAIQSEHKISQRVSRFPCFPSWTTCWGLCPSNSFLLSHHVWSARESISKPQHVGMLAISLCHRTLTE